jgi:EAL domain-containing protein (putative c-di-GMP-specific phosphodiesterase class I)/DNA-binding response OmpR family regulator
MTVESDKAQTVTGRRELEARDTLLLCFAGVGGAEALALELRNHGFRSQICTNAELPPAVRNERIAAILVDRQTLNRTGETLGQVADDIPLIVVSERDDLQTRLQAVRLGAGAFFTTPINLQALFHHLFQLQSVPEAGSHRTLMLAPPNVLDRLIDPLAREQIEATLLTDPDRLLSELDTGEYEVLIVYADSEEFDASNLIRAVRQVASHYVLPAILLTASDKRRFDEQALAAGVDAVVGLQVEPKDLAAIVRGRASRAAGVKSAHDYLAKRDPVAGLYNRHYFIEVLRGTLAASQGRTTAALLCVQVLPAPSRQARADQILLSHAADQLRRRLPALAMPAVIDGNTLAAIIPIQAPAEAERLAAQLSAVLEELELEHGGEILRARSRLAVTLLSPSLQGAGEALARALQAVMAQDLETSELEQGEEGEVALALKRNRFRLVYQPIANLNGHPTSLYEVFVRMLAEDGADILPLEFLPEARRTGLAGELDRWVISRAIHVLEQQRNLKHEPTLFIKLLPETIADSRLPVWLREQLARSGLKPSRLVFQLTLEAAQQRRAEAEELARELKWLGCGVALEHYDPRQDEAQLLAELPLDYVKLAPELTRNIIESPEQQRTIQNLAARVRAAKAQTVAALIQDAVSLSVLWRCGVDYIQGYFMQEPSDVFAPDPAPENTTESDPVHGR